MLQHISNKDFIETLAFTVCGYYTVVAIIFYPKEIGNWCRKLVHGIMIKDRKGS